MNQFHFPPIFSQHPCVTVKAIHMVFEIPHGVAKHIITSSFSFFTTIRFSHYHTFPPPSHNKPLITITPQHFIVKIISTLFLLRTSSNSLSDPLFLSYLTNNLTPPLAFDIVKNLNTYNPLLGFKFFQFTKQSFNLYSSFWTYNTLFRSLCQHGHHNAAKLLYQFMRSDGLFPNSKLLGFLVSSFSLAGSFDFSMELLSDAHSNKVVDVVVYNNFLNILVKHDRLDDAICVFRELMVRSCSFIDTCTFNILMRGLCIAGEIDEAFKFLNDMTSFGCSPDVVSYNTLIHGLCKINEVDRAHDLLKEVCLRDDIAPCVVSYTTVISGYCKLSKMKEACSLFDEMVGSGTKPSAATFNALIDGFVKVGNMGSAIGMYKKMDFRGSGCSPDVVTFTSLIDGYCRVGEVNYGLDLWREMKERNISANLYTFSILIGALCKSNRLQEAHDLLRLLKQSDIVPQPFVYNPVVDGYCKSGNVDKASEIVVEMEEKCKPDKLTFTILIIGHCMKGREPEAINIFYKMLAAGCLPDDITIKTLSSCLLKSGMPSEAARIKKTFFEDQGISLKNSYSRSTSSDMPTFDY